MTFFLGGGGGERNGEHTNNALAPSVFSNQCPVLAARRTNQVVVVDDIITFAEQRYWSSVSLLIRLCTQSTALIVFHIRNRTSTFQVANQSTQRRL